MVYFNMANKIDIFIRDLIKTFYFTKNSECIFNLFKKLILNNTKSGKYYMLNKYAYY